MNRTVRTALVLAFFACASMLLVVPASAQSVYGSIFGTVTDSTGAAIPNATITVKDEAKGTVVTAVSNGSGDYSVPHLIPDVYDLKVSAKGFKVFETKGISVEADAAPRIDPTLEIGAENTTIEVNADSQPELKTDRADVATIFDQQQVSSLPVGDQNFTNLQLLLPGAQKLGWSHAADENPQASQQIQVDGQAFGGTAFELDGTDNQDPILGIIVVNPALDAVTETKITTQNFDAELGKAVSAVVTAQTRSGTNSFHGSAYDFRTGNANLARDPYTEPPGPNAIPPGLKNRFGGSIGGPVIKDKFFFFGNYEAQRQKVGVSNTDAVPTANLMSSCLSGNGCDFSDYAAALTGSASNQLIYDNTSDQSPATLAAFAANTIPNSLLSTPALNLMKIMQPFAPNTGGTDPVTAGTSFVEGNYAATGTGLFNSNQWTERLDYTINDKMHAFERFSRFTDLLSGKVMFGAAGGPGFGLGAPPYGGNSNGANDSLAGGMDIAISPKLLTDFRLGYYRYNIIDTKFDQGVDFATQLGIPGINLGDNFTSGAPGFIMHFPFTSSDNSSNESLIGGGLGINRCNCPLTEREDQFQIVNNWTKIWGNHTVKVGADLRYARNLRVPSDTDRAGQMDFKTGPTSNAGTDGLGFASFMLGDVTTFGRYVGNAAYDETNAKEFQKRTFFYGQDTWRVSRKLTLNLGLRWELYFPEAVNGVGHGSLMNLSDGYMHVAGIGGIPSDMGWGIDMKKQFDPRIGATYQLDDKTVIRAGYGRSFDTGVFGSIFGHVVTQNLPVLADQAISEPGNTGTAFNMSVGPPANVFPTVPSNGLLPAQGYSVSPKARPNPLRFPTIDAWNLAVQRAITSTMNITVAYVGNKGTHTLGDGDNNNTNPNEAALFLPGQYSVTGQTLHYDPAATGNIIDPDGGVSNAWFLQRYYGGSTTACKDPNYIGTVALAMAPYNEPYLTPGMCGWTNSITNYSDDLNTEFDALQVTLTQQMAKGLTYTANYQWASAFDQAGGYSTWNKSVVHQRDGNVRDQQLVLYGSYDLPFGKGKQFMPDANRVTDLLIGGFQLSGTMNWSGGLPFSISYSNFGTTANPETCTQDTGTSSAPCRPNATGHLSTNLTKFDPVAHTRSFWTPQPTSGGRFSFPGLDVIGNAGANTYWGPRFFSSDMAVTKAFTIWENVAAKFRMDAFNVFNHINAGNPYNGDIFQNGPINSEANGCVPNGDCGPRQLEFSLRVQF
jgi:outer membrane receptor protein involved in Fe transport